MRQRFFKICKVVIVTLITMNAILFILLNTPFVQQKLTRLVSYELARHLHTELSIGRIEYAFPNRLFIDDVHLSDRENNEILRIARISAKIQFTALLKEQRIVIHTAQLNGFKANITRLDENSPTNFQFVLDALKSEDKTQEQIPLDLRINTLFVRHGNIAFHTLNHPETPEKFNADHLDIKNFNADISLKSVKNDSLNAIVKRMDFKEQSGFCVSGLQMRILADSQRFMLTNFDLKLPDSRILLDTLHATYSNQTNNNDSEFCFEGNLSNKSYITPQDLSAFIPALSHFKERMKIALSFNGNNSFIELPYLHITSPNRDVSLSLIDAFADMSDKENPYLNANLEHLNINEKGLEFLTRNLTPQLIEENPIWLRLEFINLNGKVNGRLHNLNTQSILQSGIGNVTSNLQFYKPTGENNFSYKGHFDSEELNLKQLLGEESNLNNVALNVDLSGKFIPGLNPTCYIKGEIPYLQYNQYEYQDIVMDGNYTGKGFDGLISLNDENIQLNVNGAFDLATHNKPSFNLSASINHFNPHNLSLTQTHKDCEYSFRIKAHFIGNNIDNIYGEVNIDSLQAIVPNDFFYMNNLNICATQLSNGEKQITAKSDFMEACIEGAYDYKSLSQSLIFLLEKHLPSLITPAIKAGHYRKRSKNNFHFDLTLHDSNFYPYVLGLPLTISPVANLKGYVNDHNSTIKIEGFFPTVEYDKTLYENGMLTCENTSEEFHTHIRVSQNMEDGSHLNLTLTAKAQDDKLQSKVTWGNNAQVTYTGEINAITQFSRSNNHKQVKADINILPSEFILNDTIWKLHESSISIDSGRISIDRFFVNHENQHLDVSGCIGDRAQDSLVADLSDIKLEYIFDILNFHPVDFTGKATGQAYVSQALKNPKADAYLHVKDFTFNGGLMGNMNLKGEWDNEIGVLLNADIQETNLSRTLVKGYVSPQRKGLDLQIQADSTNLAFLNSFVKGIFSNISGRTTGNIHLHGTFKELCLEGRAIADARAHVDALGTNFNLKRDSVYLGLEEIRFNNAEVFDDESGKAIVNGVLTHQHLKNMSYDFHFQTEDLLFFKGNEKDESLPFYGNIYGTGNAHLYDNNGDLHVTGNMRTNPKTLFVYNAGSPGEITNTDFISFNDLTPRPQQYELPKLFQQRQKQKEEEESNPMDIYINVSVDVTTDATIKVILDPLSGDYVLAHGNGILGIDFHNKGKFLMQGTYTATDGIYKMSMQDVIRKDFHIQPGSEVSFSGDPSTANLDFKAYYPVNSASLTDLIPDATFNQNSVKVNCIVLLTGPLASPTLSFDIDLPTVNEEERQLVRSAISTDEQMKTQFIYLLGIGKFYTYDYANYADYQSSNAMSSLLSYTLSGQLNSILSQALNMSNWNFASNFSTGQEGWSDLEVEGILSGRLLNNRLLINGAFGYKENQLAYSNFVGDFNIQWLLTPSGDISLKAYNMTNDRYFAKTTFNTQGIGVTYKRDFDRWSDLFKSRRKQKKEQIGK